MDGVPEISVIMPVYNAGARLNVALDSVLGQCGVSFELIVVNDGSSDSSGEVLRAYKNRFPEKISLIETPNMGAACARNTALAVARGEWVYFCDADDAASPEICSYLLGRAKSACAQMATCALERVLSDGTKSDGGATNCPTRGEETIGRAELERRWIMPLFRFSNGDHRKAHGYMPISLFRRDIIARNNISFIPGAVVQEDEVFMLEYLCHCETAALSDRPLYSYVFSDNSACSNFFRGRTDISRIEANRFLIARKRREIWGRFFTGDCGLASLFSAEAFHRCMSICARGGFFQRLADMRTARNELMSLGACRVAFGCASSLSRSKRAFLGALRMGALPVCVFCKILAVLRKS